MKTKFIAAPSIQLPEKSINYRYKFEEVKYPHNSQPLLQCGPVILILAELAGRQVFCTVYGLQVSTYTDLPSASTGFQNCLIHANSNGEL